MRVRLAYLCTCTKSLLINLKTFLHFRLKKCELFDPVITDMGICQSFNAVPTLDLLRSSYFTNSFQEAYAPDLPQIWNVTMGDGSGEENSLDFYLFDRDSVLGNLDEKFSFFIGLSSKNDYFGMKSIRQRVKPGNHIMVQVHATEIRSSDDLRSVPIGLYFVLCGNEKQCV